MCAMQPAQPQHVIQNVNVSTPVYQTQQTGVAPGYGYGQRLWSPGVAALLSFFIPGLGQLYKGSVAVVGNVRPPAVGRPTSVAPP